MAGRYVYWIAGILAATAGYACWCRAPLIWDGAYQLNTMLIMQHPYVYLTRFHTWFLWWPTVWASHLTSNMMVLQTVYGLPFLLALAIGLLLSWWMVRRHAPYLILWVVFGVAAATLPGQIFVINDSIFQQHLFWPIFVGLFVPLTWPKRIVLVALAAFQFVHPLGVMLLLGGALAAGGVAMVDIENRRRLLFRAGLLALLCALAVAKIEITNHLPHWCDTYAQQEATWLNAKQRWLDAVRGLPLDGLRCMYAAGALALAQPLLKRRWPNVPPVAGILAMVFAAMASVFWIQWASRPYWGSAIDYRRWVGPLTVPFFLAGALEVFLRARRREQTCNNTDASSRLSFAVVGLEYAGPHPNPPPAYREREQEALTSSSGIGRADDALLTRPALAGKGRVGAAPMGLSPAEFPESFESISLRGPLGVLVALIFAIVLGIQCTMWANLTDQLMADVRAYPSVIVPDWDPSLAWKNSTPLAHWATADYVTAMQGKSPAKVMLDWRSEQGMRANPPRVPHWDFYPKGGPTPGPSGWFDFRPLLRQLGKEAPPARDRHPPDQDVTTVPN